MEGGNQEGQEVKSATTINSSAWIPVTNSLPDKWPFVVRWDDYTADHTCNRYEIIDHDPDRPSPQECINWGFATHWMPLPEPPK